MKKKILGIITAFVMVLSVVSFIPLKAESRSLSGGVVAEIGSDKYTSLSDAISAASNSATISLIEDVVEAVSVPTGKNVTLNLNGHKLTSSVVNTATITNNGTLIIEDKVGSGVITRDTSIKSYYVIDNQGTMTIKSGEISVVSPEQMPAGSSLIRNAGEKKPCTLNIEGGYLFQDGFIAVKNDDLGVLNVSGGEIKTHGDTSIYTVPAIQNWGTANIKDATIGNLWCSTWGDQYQSHTIVSGNTVIDGKIIIKKNEIPAYNGNNNPTLEINGGTINVPSAHWIVGEGAEITVSGGTYVTDVTSYLATGYNCVKVGDIYKIAPKATGVTLDKTAIRVEKGSADTLTTTLTPVISLDKATWESANEAVATVDENGKVTGIKAGTTTITAKVNGKEAKCEVTVFEVKPPVVETTPSTGDKTTVTVDKEAVEVLTNVAKEVVKNVETTKAISEDTKVELKEAIKEGKIISVKPEVIAITEVKVEKETVAKIEKVLGAKDEVAQYFEINMYLTANGETIGTLNELSDKVEFTVTIDKELLKSGRTFYMVRYHEDGTLEKLEGTLNGNKFTFATDKFSTYALVYDDTKTVATVDTGDTTSTNALLALMGLAIVGMGSVVYRKRVSNK